MTILLLLLLHLRIFIDRQHINIIIYIMLCSVCSLLVILILITFDINHSLITE
jgi:hypothetical protein